MAKTAQEKADLRPRNYMKKHIKIYTALVWEIKFLM